MCPFFSLIYAIIFCINDTVEKKKEVVMLRIYVVELVYSQIPIYLGNI